MAAAKNDISLNAGMGHCINYFCAKAKDFLNEIKAGVVGFIDLKDTSVFSLKSACGFKSPAGNTNPI
ncbi:MAG: hypothetical protein ACRCZ9_00645 [Fusobacteriaceae bacterium]